MVPAVTVVVPGDCASALGDCAMVVGNYYVIYNIYDSSKAAMRDFR